MEIQMKVITSTISEFEVSQMCYEKALTVRDGYLNKIEELSTNRLKCKNLTSKEEFYKIAHQIHLCIESAKRLTKRLIELGMRVI